MIDNSFNPGLLGRNPHIQTFFASSKIRTIGKNRMLDASQTMIIEAEQGVRLLGHYSAQKDSSRKGLVTLLHGWEGSSDSSYILSAGRYFYENGYDICRLNMRDHGDSHFLNTGIFHGGLIEEVFYAIRNISLLTPDLPHFLLGFSLGGNFMLRVAIMNSKIPINNLRHVVAVSPALDPHKATISIDKGLLYRKYFLKKWKNSLRKKQSLFPDLYDFSHHLQLDTCMKITEAVMIYNPDFKDYRDYFNSYTLRGDFLDGLNVPVTIITSEDDPVIPIDDVRRLKKNPLLNLSVHRYGGHCGFFSAIPFDCWYEKKIEAIFESSFT